MTLEEAQNKILELTDKLNTVTNERDTLSQNNKTLEDDLKKARELNQTYYERLEMGKAEESSEEPDETPTSCEDFAKTLHFIK